MNKIKYNVWREAVLDWVVSKALKKWHLLLALNGKVEGEGQSQGEDLYFRKNTLRLVGLDG